MPEWLSKYVGGGLIAVLAYIIISNTLWLLFGSRVLQSLPGVNMKGVTGTLKIAILIMMSVLGLFVWIIKWPFILIGVAKKQSLQESMSYCIQSASRLFAKRL